MRHAYSRIWGRKGGRPDWRRDVRDFLNIADPRLARNEIAHAHICDKMPLLGLEPATLALAAQTFTELTKWSGGVDFLRAGSMAKFHGAIQTKAISFF